MATSTSVPVMAFGLNDGSQSTTRFPVLSREQILYNEAAGVPSWAPSNRRRLTTCEKTSHIDESGFSMNDRSKPGLTRDHGSSAHRIHCLGLSLIRSLKPIQESINSSEPQKSPHTCGFLYVKREGRARRVLYSHGAWTIQIRVGGRTIDLGPRPCLQLAHAPYCTICRDHSDRTHRATLRLHLRRAQERAGGRYQFVIWTRQR